MKYVPMKRGFYKTDHIKICLCPEYVGTKQSPFYQQKQGLFPTAVGIRDDIRGFAKPSTKYFNRHWSTFFPLLVLFLSFLTSPGVAQEDTRRALQVEDLFRLEQLGRNSTTFSPDGNKLAYVQVRSKRTASTFNSWLTGKDRGDVWVVRTKDEKPRNITNGANKKTGYWGPIWSPEGQHLALLSNVDNNICLHIWNSKTNEMKQVSERGIAINLYQNEPVWFSETEIVFPILPEGEQAMPISMVQQTPRLASEAWSRMREGKVTASVLTSSLADVEKARPHGQLLLYNVKTSKIRTIFNGDVRNLSVSPNQKWIAGFAKIGVPQPKPNRLVPTTRGEYQIQVFNRQGVLPAGKLKKIKTVIFMGESIEWSPDGSRFAFAGALKEDAKPEAMKIFTYVPASDKLIQYDLGDFKPYMPSGSTTRPPKMRWTTDNRLLIQAHKPESQQPNWWIVEKAGPVRKLAEALPAAPGAIYRIAGEKAWTGVSGGDVWKIPADGSKPVNLTSDLQPRIIRFIGIDKKRTKKGGIREVLTQAVQGPGESSFYQVSLTGNGFDRIKKPSSTANVVAYSSQTDATVLHASDRTGTYLWLAQGGASKSKLLFKTNQYLQNIAKAESRKIEYVSLDGDSLFAWLMLPVNYKKGQRYPLVTFNYPGYMANPQSPLPYFDLNSSINLNFQLLASHGYAVLFPSMPRPPVGKPGNPYMELMDGVLPAVQKTIELGIADPKALAVMGHSFGGYGTYGLITQTDRFDAAIALAGPSNLISMYGQFDAKFRYNEFPQDFILQALLEYDPLRMEGPPWKNMQRYILNSPITNVERVHTPVLIMQGDLDYVPIQQGEEFFNALHRQNKPTKFVRYWGEGHVLSNPANIKHMWQQIFGWLDKYLKPKPEKDAPRKTPEQSN